MKILKKLQRIKRRDLVLSDFDHVFCSDMPDGHLSCGCGCPFFWVVVAEGERRIYVVCSNCEKQLTLHFTPETILDGLGEGECHCDRHPKSQWCVIKNNGVVCVGCRNCETEIRVNLYNDHLDDERKGNLIV